MLRPYHWLALILPTYFLPACGGADTSEIGANACSGLNLALVDAAIAPPANVAGLVRVTDCAGDPIGVRLDQQHFTLSEDGRALSSYEGEHAVFLAERQTQAKTIILLDLSGSIVRAGLRDFMIDGAAKLVAQLPGRHEVAVFGFDGRPDLVRLSGFTSDRIAIGAALELARQAEVVDDSTNLYGAVVSALRVLDNAVDASRTEHDIVHGALVLFTDGDDRAARVAWGAVDRGLDDTPHSTFAIGVGPEIDETFLGELGRSGAVYAGAASEIVQAFKAVGNTLRAHAEATYVVSHCSPARAGTHTLTIEAEYQDRYGQVQIDFSAEGFGGGCRPEDAPLR
ncbi:MAG: hypothetical protein RMA76_11900 [Deltaproteobacteria bacterium]|jgi:hypothetical protein